MEKNKNAQSNKIYKKANKNMYKTECTNKKNKNAQSNNIYIFHTVMKCQVYNVVQTKVVTLPRSAFNSFQTLI